MRSPTPARRGSVDLYFEPARTPVVEAVTTVPQLLTSLGLQRLIPKFEAEEIDMTVLPYLSEDHFEYLGANTLGAKLRLTKAIQNLRAATSGEGALRKGIAGTSTPSGSLSGSHSTLPAIAPSASSMESLEASVERMVSTVLMATNTLTETMHFITTKLTTHQPKPSSNSSSPTHTQ